MTAVAPRPRRVRSTTESLLSIALGLEAALVFFVMLTVFGVRALPAAAAFLGGLALIVALVLVGGLVRYRWGIWLGWVLQAVLIAIGLVLPVMYAVGAGFVAIWVFCFVKGRQIDRARAAALASHPIPPDTIRPDPVRPDSVQSDIVQPEENP